MELIDMDYFLAIDFDGTIAKFDVTDAVLEAFALPKWLEIEQLWQQGMMGSQECLSKQIALIDAPLAEILTFVENIEIDATFIDFVRQLRQEQIPFAIVSDGFQVFIDHILAKNGLPVLPVFANKIYSVNKKLMAAYPYSHERCASGTCKCHVAEQAAQGLPVYLIGDGQSDFCLAGAADFVYAKAKLADYCIQKNIPHYVYTDFQDIMLNLRKQQIEKSGIA
jgi:Haloacid Dehalogenase superfamily, subfamily IB, phosphoserine phosphatase-like/2,3-diketo-5-methylthio-1-phosphopentane phosphatase